MIRIGSRWIFPAASPNWASVRHLRFVWFRNEIVLPDPLPAGRALLFLGSVQRMDTAYINGMEVGSSA